MLTKSTPHVLSEDSPHALAGLGVHAKDREEIHGAVPAKRCRPCIVVRPQNVHGVSTISKSFPLDHTYEPEKPNDVVLPGFELRGFGSTSPADEPERPNIVSSLSKPNMRPM